MLRRRFASSPGLDALLHAAALEPSASMPDASPMEEGHEGRVHLNPRGFAFVTTDAGESYFIRASLARGLLTGDRIEFMAADGDGDNQDVRIILRVMRPDSLLLCEVHEDFGPLAVGGYSLTADDPCFFPLQLSAGATPYEAGDVVAVRVPAFDGDLNVNPVLVTVVLNLGARGRPGFDLDYAKVRFGFHVAMPEGLREEALHLGGTGVGETADAWTAHAGIPFVTIDGESTRDFDDAVFAQRIAGGWQVQVAVADVSWYVQPGSALDLWAADRCTSLYLPGRTEPMLPESLSNDRCSLTPGELKRAVVMTLTLDELGQVVSSRLSRGLIQSAARLTYTQVAAFLAGKSMRFAQPVEANLEALAAVYALLAKQREEAGRLDFDDPEPVLVSNEDGSWRLHWETRNDAHKLVEEMMLLANRTAAAMLVQRYGAGLFRHQPPPDAEAWQELRGWAQAAELPLPEEPSMRALAALAASVGKGEAHAAAALRIRSAMQPAKYVVQGEDTPGGHFSLSVNWYTHFTSPIRRYADLLVHRLLLAPEGSELRAVDLATLGAQVALCSDRSHAARMAERMVWDRLKLNAFVAETAQSTPVRARVVRAQPRGLRVVLHGWQCSAWLSSAELHRERFEWRDDAWVRTAGLEAPRLLTEGSSVMVTWREVSLERPAYPELQVALAPEVAC